MNWICVLCLGTEDDDGTDRECKCVICGVCQELVANCACGNCP